MSESSEHNPLSDFFIRAHEKREQRIKSAQLVVNYLEGLKANSVGIKGTELTVGTVAEEILSALREDTLTFTVSNALEGDALPLRRTRDTVDIVLPDEEKDQFFDLDAIREPEGQDYVRGIIRNLTYSWDYFGLEIASSTTYLDPNNRQLWNELYKLYQLHMKHPVGFYDRRDNTQYDTDREIAAGKVVIGRWAVINIAETLRPNTLAFPKV